MQLTLDSVICDWVTLTGKDDREIADYWLEYQATNDDKIRVEPKKWLQWNCDKHYYPDGHILTGMAEIKSDDWMLVRASGERANDVLMFFWPLIESGKMECKRIDLQITTEQGEKWEQIRFLNRMYARGKEPEMRRSTDAKTKKELMTVAVGSRLSDTYHRIYQKITDGGELLLRYEVEFKNKKAQAVAEAMKDVTFSQQLKYQLQSRVKDDQLTAMFARQLENIKPHNARPKVSARDKKKEWLLSTILPSFEEYINGHSDDGEVVQAFLVAIENMC